MKVIIAGTRSLSDRSVVNSAIEEFVSKHGMPTEVVCGGATGADAFGKEWAIRQSVPVKHFMADWKRYWKRAGPMRNKAMAQHADALVACWNGTSRGTASMLSEMRKLGKLVLVWRY